MAMLSSTGSGNGRCKGGCWGFDGGRGQLGVMYGSICADEGRWEGARWGFEGGCGQPGVMHGSTCADEGRWEGARWGFEGDVANLVAMLCSKGPGIFRCTAAKNPTLQSIAIQDPDSARRGPSGRSLSLNRKWLLFQLPQLSQRSR